MKKVDFLVNQYIDKESVEIRKALHEYQHSYLVANPGTGKTTLIETICEGIFNIKNECEKTENGLLGKNLWQFKLFG